MIRHKAKNKENGEWVEGFYVEHHILCDGKTIKEHAIWNQSINAPWSYFTEIDFDTLGVCIGRKDIKGKLIFENDIVRLRNKRYERIVTGCIMYDSELAAFVCHVDTDTYASEYSSRYLTLDSDIWDLEVIGNFYDNDD